MGVAEEGMSRVLADEPIAFHLGVAGVWVGSVMLVMTLAAGVCLNYYGFKIGAAIGGLGEIVIDLIAVLATLTGPLVAIVIIRRARRDGKIVIDPSRGEVRMGGDYEIPFSRIRKVEVVEHEYTYHGANVEGGSFSADVTGWGIDIGAGSMLFGENGLSRKRVEEIADALKARVDAYRARTGEAAAPLPRPSKKLLERLAVSLREEGEAFEDDWLALDGPMVELMREFHVEPDARTMGPEGEFALALRKVGYDLGDAPATAPPGDGAR